MLKYLQGAKINESYSKDITEVKKKKTLDAKGKKSICQFRKSHKVIHEKQVFESTLGQPIQ